METTGQTYLQCRLFRLSEKGEGIVSSFSKTGPISFSFCPTFSFIVSRFLVFSCTVSVSIPVFSQIAKIDELMTLITVDGRVPLLARVSAQNTSQSLLRPRVSR